MKFFNVKSVEETKKLIKNNLNKSFFSSIETNLFDSLGEIFSKDILSPEISPLYNRSTVDGFAVCAQDTFACSSSIPAFLKIVGKIKIGENPTFDIHPGEAAEIVTGATIPNGATGVVMVENVDVIKDTIAVNSPIKPNENIIKAGEEISIGQKIVKIGEFVTPLNIGVLSSIGITSIPTYRKIKIGIISTGDELVDISCKAENGKIRDVNTGLLASYIKECGMEVSYSKRIKDNLSLLKEEIIRALEISDILLLSGGSSIGSRDYTATAFEELGTILLHGLGMKPGKPTILALIQNKLVFGLPGNPFAAFLVFKELCINSINELKGHINTPFTYATITSNIHSTPGRKTLQPVKIEFKDGKIFASPVYLKSSHLATMLNSDGYVKIDTNEEGIYEGAFVPVYSFY